MTTGPNDDRRDDPRGDGDRTPAPAAVASPSDPPSADPYDFSLDRSLASWDGRGGGHRDSSGHTLTWSAGFPPPAPDPSVHEVPGPVAEADFGRYALMEEIGRGGMGVVYKARQKDLDRFVAIKMILASHLASPKQVERFYAEARAAARVQHPNIVVIHEVGQCRGQHYFAMEYVAGGGLPRLIEHGPLPPEAAARHVLTVARAVEHLHAQGIVHRDLKPSNILLDEAGQPYVTDFGLAKMLESAGNSTKTGAIVGTPSYMAPEQAAGRVSAVGPRSDIYSLGAILFELLTARPPFRCDNPMETLVQVLEGEPPRPSQLRPGLPPALESICLKCLEKDPADRYPTAAALAEDLGRYLHGEPVEARREGALHRLRRWARREPALASRLGTMSACGLIMQGNHHLVDGPDRDLPRNSIAVVLTWGLASIAFQGLLRRGWWDRAVRYAWAFADVLLFTALVFANGVLQTSLAAGYFLLVAASGLWFRERLVWFTTVLAVAAYGGLVLQDISAHADPDAPSYAYRDVIFATALAISGLIVAYQVKRVRALSHYYEHRPLG